MCWRCAIYDLGGNTRSCYVLEKGVHCGNSCVLFSTQAICTRETVLSIRPIRFKYSTCQKLSIICHICDMPLWNSHTRERSFSSVFPRFLLPLPVYYHTRNHQYFARIFAQRPIRSLQGQSSNLPFLDRLFSLQTPILPSIMLLLKKFTLTVGSTLSCILRGLRSYNAESTSSHGRHIISSFLHNFHLLSILWSTSRFSTSKVSNEMGTKVSDCIRY